MGGLFALLASAFSCGPSSLDLPPLELENPSPLFPSRGIIPCQHPTRRNLAFDQPAKLGISAQEAFAEISGQCSAPFQWTVAADAQPETTEVSVEVVLDRDSAVEVTYPTSDICANKLMVDAQVVLRTADAKLAVSSRGTFTYRPAPSDAVGPLQSPAEITVSAQALQAALSGAAGTGQYVVRVGGAGSACAGEIRRQQQVASAGAEAVVGTWSESGCPLGEVAVSADSSPELELRMEQLAKAWQDAHLDAAWESADRTQLELDVEVASAPICQNHYRVITVPVNVRYGTSDGIVPVHDVLGHVTSNLLSNEPTVQLLITEETDCSQLAAAPGYCENLRSAQLRFEIAYPNAPAGRLAHLVVAGKLRGSSSNSTTQQLLMVAGTPHTVECLLTFDCAVDEICDDGLCRARARTQTWQRCTLDSDCSVGGHCTAGTCSL